MVDEVNGVGQEDVRLEEGGARGRNDKISEVHACERERCFGSSAIRLVPHF